MNLKSIFAEIIELADRQRPGYAASLRYKSGNVLDASFVNAPLRDIYDLVCGTLPGSCDEKLVDFIPGFYLLPANSMAEKKKELEPVYDSSDADDLSAIRGFIPFLADYSGDFYLTAPDDTGVYYLDHVLGVARVSANLRRFLETVLYCYQQEVYYATEDGWLDADERAGIETGRRLNPDCDYWNE